MKVAAIIPARAGSVGIPNKNLRLIHGRPMIDYAIENARNSRYIQEVYLSSDWAAMEIIAKQKHIHFIKRPHSLCQNDTTLDAVIAHALNYTQADIIITMQPTSPTLTTKSLDKAIEKMLTENWDTIISVRNDPHLAWKKNANETIVPAYTQRLNRQYLPAWYKETGAFLITKRAFITPNSRFGKKVGIYELPENEALDIDTFADLQLARQIMFNPKVAIYVNGNTKRGLGHIYRALELADELNSKPDIYYDTLQTKPEIFGSTTHHLIGVQGLGNLFSLIQQKHYDLWINDILDTSIDYMLGLKEMMPHTKIINFEDDGEGAYVADLVINALYDQCRIPHTLAGPTYYLAPKLFLLYQPIQISLKVQHILIAFGGADPQNYTERMLALIQNPAYDAYHFKIVLGRAKQNVDTLLSLAKKDHIEIVYDVENMPELMSQADLAFTSRGRTAYELAMLGVPTVAMAQNQREEAHRFISNENGFCYLGLQPSDHLLKSTLDYMLTSSYEERKKLHQLLIKHPLRQGRQQLIHLINELTMEEFYANTLSHR